ncbi:hypothetical protein MAHJHV59_50520 [Mycobacterium avium subsp. hominissuis]
MRSTYWPGGQTQFAAPVWMPRARRGSIREVQEIIEAEPGRPHTVDELARRAAMVTTVSSVSCN